MHAAAWAPAPACRARAPPACDHDFAARSTCVVPCHAAQAPSSCGRWAASPWLPTPSTGSEATSELCAAASSSSVPPPPPLPQPQPLAGRPAGLTPGFSSCCCRCSLSLPPPPAPPTLPPALPPLRLTQLVEAGAAGRHERAEWCVWHGAAGGLPHLSAHLHQGESPLGSPVPRSCSSPALGACRWPGAGRGPRSRIDVAGWRAALAAASSAAGRSRPALLPSRSCLAPLPLYIRRAVDGRRRADHK